MLLQESPWEERAATTEVQTPDRHVINADLRELKDVFGRQLEQVNIETE